jgi:TPR repeat protein
MMGKTMGRQIAKKEAEISITAVTAEDLLEIGMKYCTGHDVSKNLVAAHKWFNLAALKGSVSAKQYRCEISREMSPADVADAQRQARDWLTLH